MLSLSPKHSKSSAPEVSPETCSFQEKPSYFVKTNCDIPIAVRKGRRSCTKHPIAHFLSYKKIDSEYKTFVANLSNETISRNIKEALTDPKWKETINEKIKALQKNNTWEVSDLPKGKNVVGSKWVFTIKYKSNGTIERYKTCLVAKGYT